MIVIDPVALGDAVTVRASPGKYVDAAGVLQTAPANALRVTFDPVDLTAPPVVMVERTATNYLRNNTMQGGAPDTLPSSWGAAGTQNGIAATVHGIGIEEGVSYLEMSYVGTAIEAGVFTVTPDGPVAALAGQRWAASVYTRLVSGALPSGAGLLLSGLDDGGNEVERTTVALSTSSLGIGRQRASAVHDIAAVSVTQVAHSLTLSVQKDEAINLRWRIGMPQLERDGVTSVIATSGAAGTRAADEVPAGPALLYSNVAVPEPAYNAATSYGLAAMVVDPASHIVYESLVAANAGNALSDTTKWTPRGVTNRWKMLDQYNNTQTDNPERIVLVMTTGAIAQGIYLGNLDATSISVVVQDRDEGVVHVEEQNLVVSSTGSSYFKWFFSRIRRKTYLVSTLLPAYCNALVTVCIRRDGGNARCGMCALGPLVDVGLSEYGLGTEIKDYSSTVFNFDGTSTTVERGYAKRMSVDVEIGNDAIDDIHELLAAYRQKPVVWVGAAMFGAAIAFGKYSSFKNVIAGALHSKMALQIEGTV